MLTASRRAAPLRFGGWALLAVWVLPGCGLRTRSIPTVAWHSPRVAGLEEVLNAHEQATEALETLSAAGRLEVRDWRAGRQRDFSVRVLAGRGGRLYLKASVAVVTALEAVSDGRTFWLQVPSRRKVWTGDVTRPARISADSARSGAELADPPEAGGNEFDALRPADLVAALLPEPLRPRPGDTLLFESDRESFSLAWAPPAAGARGMTRRRVWLERATLQPMRARAYDEAGDLELETTFADWRDGVPRQVVLARPRAGYEVRFMFDKAQANQTLPERAFLPRTPADYEVIEVDQPRS